MSIEKLSTNTASELDLTQNLTAPFDLEEESLIEVTDHLSRSLIEVCQNAGSGHIGGSLSSVELMTALYFGGVLRYDPTDLNHPDRDLVAVRGHLGPLRYSIFEMLGEVSKEELMTYRRLGSRLQGHEEYQSLPGVDLTPSGSLGMLLSYGVGVAVASRNNGRELRQFIFLGDGEEQEGNISEAARHAATLNLKELVVVIDKNGKQLSDPTDICDASDTAKVWEGYGWDVIGEVDGHNLSDIKTAYKSAVESDRPSVIIAHTIKGNRVDGALDHFSGYHTIDRAQPEAIEKAISKHNGLSAGLTRVIKSVGKQAVKPESRKEFTPIKPGIEVGLDTSPNVDTAQGEYFQRLNKFLEDHNEISDSLYFLTADVTQQGVVKLLKIDEMAHYFNVGIREQHMTAMAHGIGLADPSSRIIINSFDAFTYRALDQLNALVQGDGSVTIIGDIAGITNSRNGKSHQTSGQPGAILSMPGATLLEPGDSRDMFDCLNWAIGESRGVVFIRSHRSEATELTDPSNHRGLQSYSMYDPENVPQMTAVSSGFTASPLLSAVRNLDRQGIGVNAINVINPGDIGEALSEKVTEGKPLLTFYNGNQKILTAAIANHLMTQSGVKRPSYIQGHGFDYGTTGTTQELAEHFKLDSDGIEASILNRL